MNHIVKLLFISVVLVFTGCENESKYSGFNAENFKFSEVALKKETDYDSKRNELLKKLESGSLSPTKLTTKEVVKYKLQDVLKKYIEKENNDYKKLEASEKDLLAKGVKELYIAKYQQAVDITDKYIITGNSKGIVTLIDKATFKKVSSFTIKNRTNISAIKAYGQNKLAIATFTNMGFVYNYKTKKLLKSFKTNSNKLTSIFIKDHKLYFGGNYNIHIFNKNNYKTYKSVRGSHTYTALYIDNKHIYFGSSTGMVYKLNKATHKAVEGLNDAKQRIRKLLYHDGKLFAASENRKIYVYDTNLKLLDTISGHSSYVVDLAIKDNYLLSSSKDATVKMWDMSKNYKEVPVKMKHSEWINHVRVDDEFIYTLSDDGYVKRWDKEAQVLIGELNTLMGQLTTYKKKLEKLVSSKNSEVDQEAIKGLIKQTNLDIKKTFKHGKIGQRYVPYTTTSYSTPKTDTTYINGRAYTSTTYKDNSYSSGGYNSDIYGYKAIYKVTNNSTKHYQIELKIDWTGKYSKYEKHSYGAWSSKSGNYSELVSSYQFATKVEKFFVAPGESFKFQFEVGEDEPTYINLVNLNVKTVPKEYYSVFKYALEPKNKDLTLLDKFLKDKKVSAWSGKIKDVKKDVQKVIQEEFSKKNEKGVKVQVIVDEKKFDRDFDSKVKLKVESGVPLCAKVSTAFGYKYIDSKKESGFFIFKSYSGEKEYTVKDISLSRLKDNKDFKIAPSCDYF